MSAVYDHHHCVLPEEIDVMGHVNNLRYLEWMMAAATAHSRAQGWRHDDYVRLGAGWVVRAHEITYLRSALPDEEVIIRTWIANWRRATSVRRYRMLRAADGAVLAEASTEWAFISFESRLPTRIPQVVADSFLVVGDEPDGDARPAGSGKTGSR